MGDTLGSAASEMQASGWPVITTDRQALTEINNDRFGWILDNTDVPIRHSDDFAHYSRDEVTVLSE